MKKEPTIIPADPSDPEDFDTTAPAIERGSRARIIRQARIALGLSQADFARRFRIPVGTLRDWEQARSTPPDFALAYVQVIAAHPELVAQSVA